LIGGEVDVTVISNSIPENMAEADINGLNTDVAALAARLVALFPFFILLVAVSQFGVNLPDGREWDLIPFLERILDGAPTGEDLKSDPIVKLAVGSLALVTDFDVTAEMVAGVVFQFLATIFLWSVLELTLRAWRPGLIGPLCLILAILMSSLAHYEIWLSGFASLQWTLGNLAAAALIWALARWPTSGALALCLVLSWIGMLGFPSGIMLWFISLFAIATQSLSQGNARWPHLVAWIIGTVLAGTYFSGLATMAQRYQISSLSHPVTFSANILVSLGQPVTGNAGFWAAGAAGLLGLVFLTLALLIARRDPIDARSIQPWLWLAGYGLLASVFWAAGILGESTPGVRYTGGLFFWIATSVIIVVAVRKRTDKVRLAGWLRTTVVIVLAAWAVWVNSTGYVALGPHFNEQQERLIALYRYNQAPDGYLESLFSDSNRTRNYLQILEQRQLGLFSGRMSNVRQRLQNSVTFATTVTAGQGYLDVAACTYIAGWAWDSRQQDVSVKVDIFDGETLLTTTSADWFRRDLRDNGVGSGRYGFALAAPPQLKDGRNHTIRARISGTDEDLNGAPKQLVCG
jgi:hypothetical protein